jgi:uncharacterized protein (DUF4213/DUF364 family)
MSKIIDEALALICDQHPDLCRVSVDKVCIGLVYTGVKLDTGHVGVHHSLLSELALRCCKVIKRAGSLAGSPAFEIVNLAKSLDISERVVGVAALNALSQIVLDKTKYQIAERNFIDYMENKVRESDTVGLVGRIEPFVKILRGKARHLHVFEMRPPLLDEGGLPVEASEQILPQADVVIITGSSIANKTIDHILELSRGAREIGVVGPSAGIPPNTLFKRGVTIIGNIEVENSKKLLQIIAEGGGTPHIKSAVKFINIRPKPKAQN